MASMVRISVPAIFLLLIIEGYAFSGGSERIETVTRKVLVASAKTDFKKGLIEDMTERYRGIADMHIIDLKELNKIDTSGYDAVVVMDSCEAWMFFNRKTRKFLKKFDKTQKLVLVITAGDQDWTYSKKGIDAITSASEEEDRDELLWKVYERLDRILGTAEE